MSLLVTIYLQYAILTIALCGINAYYVTNLAPYRTFSLPKNIIRKNKLNFAISVLSSSTLQLSSLPQDDEKEKLYIPARSNPEFDRLFLEFFNPSVSAVKRVYTLKALTSRRFASQRGKQFIEKILRVLESLVEQVPPEHLPDLIWSLMQVRLSYSDFRHRPVIDQLICRTAECVSGIPLPLLSKCVSGISLMSINLKDGQLSPRIYEKLMLLVETSIHHNVHLSKTSIYMLMHGIFVLRIRWEALSSKSQQNIFTMVLSIAKNTKMADDTVDAEPAELNKENEDLFIYHLSGLGLHKRYMSPAVETAFLTIAERTLHSISLKAAKVPNGMDNAAVLLSSMIYSLGKSGILYKSLSPTFLASLYDASEKTFLHLASRDLSAALYGLGLMNVPWNSLPTTMKKVLLQRVIQIINEMNPQSVTNVVYGLCLMQAPLHLFPPSFQHALHTRITEIFTDRNHFTKANKQALSNILYALANTGYQWTDLPTPTRSALLHGINTYAEYFIPQEFSVTISSLGILRAPYSVISRDIEQTIIKVFRRLEPELKTLHSICTLISGLGRMGATWATLPTAMKDVTLRIIMEGHAPTTISLPCIFNSFGQLEVAWTDLSPSLRHHLANLSRGMEFTEQSLSNTVFGLGLMEAKWDTLELPLKDCLTRSLSNPTSLAMHYPQHISNVVWGLSKMKLPRSELNRYNVLNSIVPSAKYMSMKELAQVVYGLSLMDFSWNELSVTLVEALADAVVDYTTMVTSQDVANMMYSLSLLCYDVDFSILDASVNVQAAQDGLYRKAHAAMLLFDYFLEKYSESYLEWAVANQQHDQYQIFLFFIKVLALESKAMQTMLNRHFPEGIQHRVTGPSATLPSITHSILCQQLSQSLKTTVSPEFSIFNEYLGCEGGVFPMDMAIYLGDVLVAFVEVDGAFHYRQCPHTGHWTLRRIDLLKEYLYRKLFPEIPIVRVSTKQVPFPVIVQHIQQVLLNEVDPRVNRWNREWKSILLRDVEQQDVSVNEATDPIDLPVNESDSGNFSRQHLKVMVRHLHPCGTAFTEEIILYAEELSRMARSQGSIERVLAKSKTEEGNSSTKKPKSKRVSRTQQQ